MEAVFKKLNIDTKNLLAKEEEWVDEESSSDEEVKKDKGLVALVEVDTGNDDAGEGSTFNADLAQDARDSRMENWDSSTLYQVKNFVSYSLREKLDIFECMRHDLARSNNLNAALKTDITCLKAELKNTEDALKLSELKCRDYNLTNVTLHKAKDLAELTASNCESILYNWTHSHHKLNKIIEAQIPEQCEKILGGNLDKAVDLYKTVEKEPNFLSASELVEDFKS